MTEGYRFQVQVCQLCLMAQPVDILTYAVELIRGTKTAIGLINVPYEVDGVLFTDILGQSTTHIRGQGQLTITEGPGPTKATDQIAGVTGNTPAVPITRRALTAINIPPFLNEQNIQVSSLNQFQGSKDTRRAPTDDDNIVLHHLSTLYPVAQYFYHVLPFYNWRS
jgi:hypothetical protein